MVTQILSMTMTGEKNVQRMLKGIPQRAKVEGKAMTKRIAKFIERSAKQRVGPGKTGTGDLMRSIQALPTDTGWKVIVGKGAVNRNGVNYARFQEYGFRPHRVSINTLNRGSRLYQELKAGGEKGSSSIGVSRWTPFMGPAYRKALSRMNMELSRTGKKIIRG